MSDTYLVCTNDTDGNFIFNGNEFEYTSRDFWSDGSTTMHLTDGSQFTWPAITDPFMRGVYLNEMCGYPSDTTWG